MFRRLVKMHGLSPNAVLTNYRPSQLAEYLESCWATPRSDSRAKALGPNLGTSHADMARRGILDPLPPARADPLAPLPPMSWHHLVYAYMLENTRILDIFRSVVLEWLTDERLPTPTAETQRWLQATEQLFFGSPWAYSVRSVTSSLRPDSGVVRRNAYFRLLGMELGHDTSAGGNLEFVKPQVANRDFTSTFEALLIEVWRAYAHRNTTGAENPTNEAAIRMMVRRLSEMLQARRDGGALSREEFDAVATLNWFHLTVETDTPIVVDLSARSTSASGRLMEIGERVGVPAHPKSDAYFQLAEPMSRLLMAIESIPGLLPADFYAEGALFTADMLNIIANWGVVTGRNIMNPS